MQIANSFDKDTIAKILRGGAIAATGAFGLFILNAIGTIDISNPVLVSFLAWFIPFASNMLREWVKGEE